MFGLGFGEFCVLIIVALIVIGPRDLPRVLRTLGQWAGKIRRMASDMRAQSGIDEVLRTEGISKDLNEIRRLARGDLLDAQPFAPREELHAEGGIVIVREREYPREGPDAYGALPEGAVVYDKKLPPSSLASDPLYASPPEAPQG